jgi:hypothetical protein
VDVLNKQSRTADKRWSSSLGFGREQISPHLKESACYEMLHSIYVMESIHEILSIECRNLYRFGPLDTVVVEFVKCKLYLIRIHEV